MLHKPELYQLSYIHGFHNFLFCCCFALFLEKEPHYVALAGFELLVLLTLPPNCQDYRFVPPNPAICFRSHFIVQNGL